MAQNDKADGKAAAKKSPFSGYYNRSSQNDDSFLTHVGPGTPCGEYMRRYGQPFLIAAELGELPITVRLLGEHLVVFRDKSGRLGLLHKHCVHRGASHCEQDGGRNPRSTHLDDYGVNKMPLLGQTVDRPYHERQVEPGDYDAMVSPGPIVNRKSEHLGTTDRGVVTIRRMLANAINALREGNTLAIPRPVAHLCA